MIVEAFENTRDFTKTNGMAVKLVTGTLPDIKRPEINDTCICDYISCEYIEMVFASNDPEDYKKDFSDFLFKRFVATDTIQLELHNLAEKKADLDNNTYGTLFDGFSEGSEEQQLYYGFLLNWTEVLNAFGGGTYFIKAKLDILGEEYEIDSRYFNLQGYSDLAADNTVKIESTQNGNILGNEFDFTGLEWKQYLRVLGRFGNPTPQYETDRYVDENQNFRQIKDKMSRQWTLETGLIGYAAAEKLIYNKLLANEILITDYSIFAESIWRKINVRLEDVDKTEIFNYPRKRYTFTFVDNEQVFQKRNF